MSFLTFQKIWVMFSSRCRGFRHPERRCLPIQGETRILGLQLGYNAQVIEKARIGYEYPCKSLPSALVFPGRSLRKKLSYQGFAPWRSWGNLIRVKAAFRKALKTLETPEKLLGAPRIWLPSPAPAAP
jgi:hypothetical protein